MINNWSCTIQAWLIRLVTPKLWLKPCRPLVVGLSPRRPRIPCLVKEHLRRKCFTTPWAIGTFQFIFDRNSQSPMFLCGFLHFLYQWKEYWMLYTGVNVQFYLYCALPDTNLKHIKRHILKSTVTVFYYSTTRTSLLKTAHLAHISAQ